ncbi:tryptophan halogenase [mine drainage metagenome]|uniref:Tryptophan halogenase n=2 Tax=mine drainage metagenome TaxID=410659 RepID=T0ZX93_9ZZZZ
MNLPVFKHLGVLEQVRALGVCKRGADFETDNERGYNVYAFARALGNSPPYAFQVLRQDFDAMLFTHARSEGVNTHEGAEVLNVEQRGDRDSRVEVRLDDGRTCCVRTRYVLDASGRDSFLATRMKLKRKNTEHQSAAIFGHFRGAERRSGLDAGNISIYNFDYGWMWMIPLLGEVMSVGAVCGPDYLKQRNGRSHEFLFETLRQNPALWSRLEHAVLIDNEVRVTGNYSYDSSTIGGPGWILVGDAFAFLDPVFSSGVYLAMSGAEQAAVVVDAALREPAREMKMQQHLEKRLRRGMRRFAFFIYRFNSPAMQHIFRYPHNVWKVEQGIISMLAGDLFDSRPVWWRLQFFRLIYAWTVLRLPLRWNQERRYRKAQARTTFSGGTTPLDSC